MLKIPKKYILDSHSIVYGIPPIYIYIYIYIYRYIYIYPVSLIYVQISPTTPTSFLLPSSGFKKAAGQPGQLELASLCPGAACWLAFLIQAITKLRATLNMNMLMAAANAVAQMTVSVTDLNRGVNRAAKGIESSGVGKVRLRQK
jgi:hypothetical protein